MLIGLPFLVSLYYAFATVTVDAAPVSLNGFGRMENGLMDPSSSRLTDDGFIDWNSLYADKRKKILDEANGGGRSLADSAGDFPTYGLDEDGDHFQNWNSMFDRPHAHFRRSGVRVNLLPVAGGDHRNGLKLDHRQSLLNYLNHGL